MRDDEIRARLTETNPWWRAVAAGGDRVAWAAADRTLRDRTRYDLGYRSPVLGDIATGPVDDKLVLVRGPRRVGKSVALKDTALALCQRPDIDPRQVIYLPTDGMRSRALTRGFVLARELTRSADIEQPVPRVWLLDEVTGMDGWTSTVKYHRDNTAFGDDTVVCTGSSWNDTGDVERDLLAGRAGSSPARRTRLLLPMRFRDFVAATRPDVPRPDPVEPWELQGAIARDAVAALELFVDELDLAWQSYLSSGGFPRAVGEHTRVGAVTEAFLNDLTAWLHRDIDHDAPLESIPRLLAELHARSTGPLNRAATADALGYANRQSLDRRLNRLVHNFAAVWCHQIHDDGTRVASAQSKLYLADPLLAWLGHHMRAGIPTPDMTALSEAALATHLAGAIDDYQPGRWITGDTIGYTRTGKGNEVDFGPVPIPAFGTTTRTTPLESKWVTQGWRSEARVMEGRYGHGVLATKTVTDFSHPVWAIPAPIVALLLH